jgi:hypothetical protein
LRIAGIDVFERIPWSIVVSLVEIILFCRGGDALVWCLRCITVNVCNTFQFFARSSVAPFVNSLATLVH